MSEETHIEDHGYRCCRCESTSNIEEDWVVTEDDVLCANCGTSEVEPEDIDGGVHLYHGVFIVLSDSDCEDTRIEAVYSSRKQANERVVEELQNYSELEIMSNNIGVYCISMKVL